MHNKLADLMQFFNDASISGGLDPFTAAQIKALWDEYKLPTIQADCSILTVKMGVLGSVVIRRVESFDTPVNFKYEPGEYDFVCITSDQVRKILWTDYSSVEPYNRQGGLYCDGASFSILGSPVVETDNYREFDTILKYNSNVCFVVRGFDYNSYYKTVQFGMCIHTGKIEEFLSSFRSLVGKDHDFDNIQSINHGTNNNN